MTTTIRALAIIVGLFLTVAYDSNLSGMALVLSGLAFPSRESGFTRRAVSTAFAGLATWLALGATNLSKDARISVVLVSIVVAVGAWALRTKARVAPKPVEPEPETTRPRIPVVPSRRIGEGIVFGRAGANVSGSTAAFGETATKAGSAGEVAVGTVLEKAVANHGGVVWHGLKFSPGGTSRADVDHAILMDDGELWLVDAKMWAYGTYEWASDGRVFRDGGPFSGSNVHIGDAQRKWRDYLGRVGRAPKVRTFIVMANPNGNRYKVRGRDTFDGVTLITLSDLHNMLLSKNPRPATNQRLVDVVTAQMLS